MGGTLLHHIAPSSVEVMEAELLDMLQDHDHLWDSTQQNWEAKLRNEQNILAHIHYLIGVHDTHIGTLIDKAIATNPAHEEKIRSYFAYWTRPL
jgi:hypothetical protein